MTAPATHAFPSIEGPGMTLREYAAIQIAASMLSRETYPKGVLTVRDVCNLSATAADALIAELAKGQGDA